MNKKMLITIVAILSLTPLVADAQRPRSNMKKNSLAFLRSQEKLHVVVNYDYFMIQGVPEKSYFEMKGQREREIEQWENAKNTTFKAAFLTHLNKNINARRMRLLCGDYPDAPYQATVYVLRNTAGRKKGVTCEIVFTQKGSNVPLAVIAFKGKSRRIGALFGARLGSMTYLTGTALGYAGENLGKYMAGKIK